MESKDSQDPGVTMSDFLQDMIQEEEAVQNILSKDETKDCTKNKGYTTQTVFGCHTCGARGGMCLACYLNCHLDHDTFEIGLKRNFCCDCGTSKFDKHACSFKEEGVEPQENTKNVYDHNFEAKFCACNQPYDTDIFMIRCLHCLDFFHLHHLNLKEDIQAIVEGNDDYTQMICGSCREKYYSFMEVYKGGNIYFTDEEIKARANEAEGPEEEKKDIQPQTIEKDKELAPPIMLGKRSRATEVGCNVQEKMKEIGEHKNNTAIFMKDNWNNNICFCEECQAMYKRNNIEEVLNEELVNAESWEQPQPKEVEANPGPIQDESLYNKAMHELSKLDFNTQGLIASLYRDFYEDFKDFFEKFKDQNVLITQDHIQEFFTYLKSKKKEVTV